MDEITLLFKKLPSIATPDEINDIEFELLEFFVVRLYSNTCNIKEVNDVRRILFSRDNKVNENIPPTKGVLRQHIPRSVFQISSPKRRQFMCQDIDGPDPCQWNWQKVENEMIPLWTDLPQTSNVWSELAKCGCKKDAQDDVQNCASVLSNVQMTNHVDLLHILYLFWKKSTG